MLTEILAFRLPSPNSDRGQVEPVAKLAGQRRDRSHLHPKMPQERVEPTAPAPDTGPANPVFA